jgi:hypothetical protein
MTSVNCEPHSVRRRSARAAVIELIEGKPATSLYQRIMNPNGASIMPQAVSVWLEQLGHRVQYVTYTGQEALAKILPTDIDIAFLSAPTHSAMLAYSISNIYRKRNVTTVLGGPHARAYADDASDYFDYVVGLTDKSLISGIMNDFSPNTPKGNILGAEKQPESLPGVRQRWKFIRKSLQKTRFIHSVPLLGSFGCPYRCGFCVDAAIDYHPMPYEQIREDLLFLQSLPKRPTVVWYDPNFAVRFDEYMDLIESAVTAAEDGGLDFVAQSSLSLLTEPNLKRLKRNGVKVVLPGVESWFAYNEKTRQGQRKGIEKLRSVADQFGMISRYIPYIQANFILGLDTDEGSAPFELTREFVRLVPSVFPKFTMLTAYGNSAPVNRHLQEEHRVIDVPFHLLDNFSAPNVRLKNYSLPEFFDHLIDLLRFSFSPRMMWKRFKSSERPSVRALHLIRAVSGERVLEKKYLSIRNQLLNDRDFMAFYSGDTMKPPAVYVNKIKSDLGSFYEELPAGVIRYLENGEPAPNPRISNAMSTPATAPTANPEASGM